MSQKEQVTVRLTLDDEMTRALILSGKHAKKFGNNAREAQMQVKMLSGQSAGVSRLGNVMGNVTAIAAQLMLALTLLATTGLGIAVKESAALEQSLARVAAVSGGATHRLQELKDAAIEGGMRTAFSAKQAADAMGFLAMAGFRVEETTAALPGVLQLAAAGMMEVADAADIASNIMTSYGFTAKDLTHVNDVLVGTFTSTNVNLRQLGDAFKFVGNVAKASGQDFEEISAAIGLMGNAGIQGSMGGRQLRMALIRLQKPPKMAADALAKLSINVREANGDMRNLHEILAELRDAGAQVEDLSAIFGAEAAPGLQALLDQGPENLKAKADELKAIEEVSKRIEQIQLDTVNGQFRIMTGALQTVAASFGDLGSSISKNVLKDINRFLASGQLLQDSMLALDRLLAFNGGSLRDLGRRGFATVVAYLDITIQGVVELVNVGNELQAKLDALLTSVTASGTAFDYLSTKIENVKTKVEEVTGPLGDLTDWFWRISPPAYLLRAAFQEVGQEADKLVKEMERLERQSTQVDFTKLKAELDDIAQKAKQAGQVLRNEVVGIMTGELREIKEIETDLGAVRSALQQETNQRKRIELRHTIDLLTIEKQRMAVGDRAEAVRKANARREAALAALRTKRRKKTKSAQRTSERWYLLQAELLYVVTLEEERRLRIQILRQELEDKNMKGAEAQLFLRKGMQRIEEDIAKKRESHAKQRHQEAEKEKERIAKQQEKNKAFTDAAKKATFAQIKLQAEGDKLALAQLEYEERMYEISRLQVSEHEKLVLQKEAQARLTQALTKEEQARFEAQAAHFGAMSDAFNQFENTDGFGHIAKGMGQVTDIFADLAKQQKEIQGITNATKEGQAALIGAISASGQALNVFAAGAGASAAQQAGILAVFEAASAAASYAYGNIPAGINHTIAAGLYAAAAAQGGVSVDTGSGATSSTGTATAPGAGRGNLDVSGVMERNAQITAEALGRVLRGENAQNVTIIMDQRGAILDPRSAAFQDVVTGALEQGAARVGWDTTALEVSRL